MWEFSVLFVMRGPVDQRAAAAFLDQNSFSVHTRITRAGARFSVYEPMPEHLVVIPIQDNVITRPVNAVVLERGRVMRLPDPSG